MARKRPQVTAITVLLVGLFAVVGPAAADQFQPVPAAQAPAPSAVRAAPIVSVFQFAGPGSSSICLGRGARSGIGNGSR